MEKACSMHPQYLTYPRVIETAINVQIASDDQTSLERVKYGFGRGKFLEREREDQKPSL